MMQAQNSKPLRYSGTGNTFVLIDNRDDRLSDKSERAVELCQKQNVDGMLVIEKSKNALFKMEIYNADGSHADMCGNGSRCAAYWGHTRAGLPDVLSFESDAGPLDAVVKNNLVKVKLTDPSGIREFKKIPVAGSVISGYFINTGVPHVVIPVENVANVDVATLGKQVRTHDLFKPKGTNVSFLQTGESNEVSIRTYERGVEAETLSCGTGATAAALVAARLYQLDSPIKVMTQSQEKLLIYFEIEGDRFKQVYLEGTVKEIN